MKSDRKLTLVTANIFFGGMELNKHNDETDVKDWLFAHFMVLVAKSEKFVRARHESRRSKLVNDLLEKFNPDILVLNEVMPDITDHVLTTLEKANYHLSIGGKDQYPYPIARVTLIASKYPGRKFPFKIPGKTGGGAAGFEIPRLNTVVLAPHPSAFNSIIRRVQLFHVKKVVKRLISEKPDRDVFVVGDFNTNGAEIDPIFSNIPLTRYSFPSFPSDSIYKQLNNIRWRWLKSVIGLNDGQKNLDHVLATSGWNSPILTPYQTTSDHTALVLNFGK